MVKEFKRGTKYFIVFVMLSIAVGIIFCILKKIIEKRELYLLEIARKGQDRHGESAIMEEHEVLQIKDENDEKNNMDEVDYTQYFEYQEYSPELLWVEYTSTKSNQQIIAQTVEDIDNTCKAKIEILIYYQTFVKLLRLHIISASDLQCFQSSESKSIKLKIMLRRPDEERFSEVTGAYDLDCDDVYFDDKFSFRLDQEEIKDYRLYISLWSVNVFYHELLLGAVSINLGDVYKPSMKNFIVENVLPVKKDRNIYGYLLVALCHVPSIERLICVVMSGKEVQEDITNKSILNNVLNPFVKISLINDGKTIKRHKTQVVLDNPNPLFNEMFEFYIPEHQIDTVDIFFLVLHKYNNKANTLIGKLMIGNHTSGDYKRHWDDALSNPEQSIARWHPLTR